MTVKIVRKAHQKNRLHHYRSQVVKLKAQLAAAHDQRGLRVGPFFLLNTPSGSLYVHHEGGEGGGFRDEDLLPHLRQFWEENF